MYCTFPRSLVKVFLIGKFVIFRRNTTIPRPIKLSKSLIFILYLFPKFRVVFLLFNEELKTISCHIIVLFVETPRKFITAVINLRGVSTNKTIVCFIAMQTYKELNILSVEKLRQKNK